MAGLVPAIHELQAHAWLLAWMPGMSPGMTIQELPRRNYRHNYGDSKRRAEKRSAFRR